MLRILAIATGIWLLGASAASAQERVETRAGKPPPRRNLVYVDVLGKVGLYGVGYERELTPSWSLGATVSAWSASAQHVQAATAYVGWSAPILASHRWFAQLGPELVREAVPAVVPGFDGYAQTRIGAQLSAGYEWRGPVLVRGYGVVAAGRGGIAPWFGGSIGWRF